MFNIGGWEVVFILLIVLLLWKPEELEDRARQLGRWWARLTHSPWWREMAQLRFRAEQFLRDAAREANLEEALREMEQTGRTIWPSPEAELRATRAYRPPPPYPDAAPANGPEPAAAAPAADEPPPPAARPAPAEPSPQTPTDDPEPHP